jgi:hypothetical protein
MANGRMRRAGQTDRQWSVADAFLKPAHPREGGDPGFLTRRTQRTPRRASFRTNAPAFFVSFVYFVFFVVEYRR